MTRAEIVKRMSDASGWPKAGSERALRAALVGAEGEALSEVGPAAGEVFVHGEYWQARSARVIPKGARVRVTAVDGLTATVVAARETG